jgi:hypothetical protein
MSLKKLWRMIDGLRTTIDGLRTMDGMRMIDEKKRMSGEMRMIDEKQRMSDGMRMTIGSCNFQIRIDNPYRSILRLNHFDGVSTPFLIQDRMAWGRLIHTTSRIANSSYPTHFPSMYIAWRHRRLNQGLLHVQLVKQMAKELMTERHLMYSHQTGVDIQFRNTGLRIHCEGLSTDPCCSRAKLCTYQ